MVRIKFQKGKQRSFLQEVLIKLNCPSFRELASRLQINYSTMKNYSSEAYFLPENLFKDLCFLSKIDSGKLKFEVINDNWGQIKGGKISRK